jgi:hypothetical protein
MLHLFLNCWLPGIGRTPPFWSPHPTSKKQCRKSYTSHTWYMHIWDIPHVVYLNEWDIPPMVHLVQMGRPTPGICTYGISHTWYIQINGTSHMSCAAHMGCPIPGIFESVGHPSSTYGTSHPLYIRINGTSYTSYILYQDTNFIIFKLRCQEELAQVIEGAHSHLH